MFLAGEEWSAYFRNFEKSAFRLEVHQVYTMPNEKEEFDNFLTGGPKPDQSDNYWHARIRANVAAGKTMTRAKVIRQPITDYTRLLVEWAIPDNVAAGENYRIIDVSDREVDLPTQDFWMFDEKTVVHLNYRADGTQINRTLIDNPDLDQYLRWRDLALAESVSFAEWRESGA